MSSPRPLTLTFAELEFVLLACPQQAEAARAFLRLPLAEPDHANRGTAAAGLASLLARGLCESRGASVDANVTPGPEISALTAAFVSARSHLTAAGWCGDQADAMYVLDAPSVRVALFPFQYGRYDVEFVDPAEPLSALLGRYLDAHLAPKQVSAFVAKATAGSASVAATAAIDASGRWSASDTLADPDSVATSFHEAFQVRLVELFDRALHAAGPTTASVAAPAR